MATTKQKKFNGTPQKPHKRPERNYYRRKGGLPCDGCNKTCGSPDYYMVQDRVWFEEAALPQRCMLCLKCLTIRLGRRLVRNDFKDVPVNEGVLLFLDLLWNPTSRLFLEVLEVA